MIKIGDFTKMFNISIKTVRYYESLGLIVPKYVDIYTGYRYFDDDNVKRMQEILALKKLGFTLDEIKNYSSQEIANKIKQFEKEIASIKEKISNLEEFSLQGKKVLNMLNFINDENAIGKWKLLGVSLNREDAENNKYIEDDYNIKELYLLPNGEKYWVISWTKGIIYINGNANTYEIDNNKLYLTIKDPYNNSDSKVVVYQNIDHNSYSVEDIKHKDNTNIEFREDKEVVGIWQTIDFVNNPNSFNPDKLQTAKDKLAIDKLIFEPIEEVHIRYQDNNYMRDSKYTKNYIVNLMLPNTLAKYEIQTINNKKYLIVEWKSGDYVFGGIINGYYVLEKMED